ncbi:MAG: indole-3-glycerol-phosphate synthase [Propionibacterium sp.]|nr:indole-3-glycerol-phosphate synthase [Propionibacterium sp.]
MGRLVDSIRARQRAGVFPVLAEVKVRSAKSGELLGDRDPAEYARQVAAAPVAGVSVVIEPEHFGGSLHLLRTVRTAVEVPILAKDFISSREQIEAAAAAGADAVLLISSMLDHDRLVALIADCRDIGVESLVEGHNDRELAAITSLGSDLVGINNRDITILEVDDTDVTRTAELARLHTGGQPLISESSITSPADVARARDAGADAVLVSTAVLQAADPTAFVHSLTEVGWP